MAGPSAGLLQYIIQHQNTLASVKPAVPALLNLKNSVQKVPFQLLVPGMGGVMNAGNIMSGITSMAGSLGGLVNIPGLQSLLSQFTSGSASLSSLQSALGGGAFAAAMVSYAPSSLLQPLSNTAQVATPANVTSNATPAANATPVPVVPIPPVDNSGANTDNTPFPLYAIVDELFGAT